MLESRMDYVWLRSYDAEHVGYDDPGLGGRDGEQKKARDSIPGLFHGDPVRTLSGVRAGYCGVRPECR
jgi:hypothetical protein